MGSSISTIRKDRSLTLTVSLASRCFSSNSRTSFFFSSGKVKAVCEKNYREMTTEFQLNPLKTRKLRRLVAEHQVKIYLKWEQLVLMTAFQKGVGQESKNHSSKCRTLPLVDKRSNFSNIFLTNCPSMSTDRTACWKTFSVKTTAKKTHW